MKNQLLSTTPSTIGDAWALALAHCRLPIGVYVTIINQGPPVYGQVHGYDNDDYVIRIGGSGHTRSVPLTDVRLHPSYGKPESESLIGAFLIAILARRLPVRLHVEVNDGTSTYYGQIIAHEDAGYRVRVGGTSQINLVAPDQVSPHPVFRALPLERQRALFEHFLLPTSGELTVSDELKEQARRLASGLDRLCDKDNPSHFLLGVCLFTLDPATGVLSVLPVPKTKDDSIENGVGLHNGAMIGQYHVGVDCRSQELAAKAYCEALLSTTGIPEYLRTMRGELGNYNVVIHLHHYRDRPKDGSSGFHKDTRGQTLFFLLHYLNDKPIYGAEYTRDTGLVKADPKTGFLVGKLENVDVLVDPEKGRVYKVGSKEPLPDVDLDSIVYTVRKSPADEDGKVWPRGICQDIRKRVSENTDTDIHALRVEPFGAILGVDDVISHQTPNENQRKDWGSRSPKDPSVALKMTHGVQALDADHVNAYYSDRTGRARERDDQPRRRRSVSRGRDHSPERYKNTFLRNEVRKFFRIWVTISHKSDWVYY